MSAADREEALELAKAIVRGDVYEEPRHLAEGLVSYAVDLDRLVRACRTFGLDEALDEYVAQGEVDADVTATLIRLGLVRER